MKKLITAVVAAIFFVASVVSSFAEVQTIQGVALCTKCSLQETAKCETAIRVIVNGTNVTYYAVDNDVAKTFHSTICQGSTNVTATGFVKEYNGKLMIKLTAINAN